MVGAQGLGPSARQAKRHEEGEDRCRPKLAVIMHRMWVNGSSFRWSAAEPAAAA